MILYHGSNTDFDKFENINTIKENGSDFGYGIYLFTDKKIPEKYGKKIYEVKFKEGKKLSSEKITLSKLEIEEIIEEAHLKYNYLDNIEDTGHYGVNFVKKKAIDSALEYEDNDLDVVNEIITVCGKPSDFGEILTKIGYTHTINKKQNSDIEEYTVFDPKNLKIIKKEVR